MLVGAHSWAPRLASRPLASLCSSLSHYASFRLLQAVVLILGVAYATLLLSGELIYTDAMRLQSPNATAVLLAEASRITPLSLPLRSAASDFVVAFGPQMNPTLAHKVLAAAMRRDPWNLAYRAAIAHLTTTPPVKGATLGGTEVKP